MLFLSFKSVIHNGKMPQIKAEFNQRLSKKIRVNIWISKELWLRFQEYRKQQDKTTQELIEEIIQNG